MKKFVAACLTAGMLATALVGCGTQNQPTTTGGTFTKTTEDGYPVQNDGQEVSYWVSLSGHVSAHSQSLNDTKFAQGLKENTGINVKFQHPTIGQETESFNLMIASRDLPDIIENSWNKYSGGPEKAITEKTIISLNDVIDQVSPNIKKLFEENADYRKANTTETGNIYVYPFIRGDQTLCTYMGAMVRKDFLDKAGLQPPETIEEWETMLRKFKEMGIKSPLTMRMDNTKLSQMNQFIGAYGAAADFYVEDGKVKYGPAEDAFVQFVELMTKWYSEGLLDSNFTDTDSKRLTSVVANGEAGAAFGSAGGDFGSWMPAAKKNDPNAEFVPVPYPVLNKGDRPKFGNADLPTGGYGAAITATSQNVELAARLLDYGYGEEGHMYYNFGIEGESYNMVDGVPTYTDIILDTEKNGGLSVGQAMGKYIRACYNGPFVQDKNYISQFYTDPVQTEAINVWSDNDQLKYAMPNAAMTEDENREYTKIITDIDTYREEIMYKTITGTMSLDDFKANYLNEMKERGIERAIQLKQQAYDRYNKQ